MAYSISTNCIGCSLCKNNCVVYAVTGELREPHSINEKRCIECGVCARLCPTEAIVDSSGKTLKKIPKESWGCIAIDIDICSGCSICVESCRFGAIQISDPKFVHDIALFAQVPDNESCVVCGLCVKRCPLNAISIITSPIGENYK
ncbi:MAG: 4Fe-4S binding protein [Oscillospiraceae bacterium]|nr:4Fe-4S binding protein [Oscillospiraceae bacterium]